MSLNASTMKTDRVAAAYGRWAPVYDLVFGPVFRRGRNAAIVAAGRAGGRVLEVGIGTGISLPDYDRAHVWSASTYPSRCWTRRVSGCAACASTMSRRST